MPENPTEMNPSAPSQKSSGSFWVNLGILCAAFGTVIFITMIGFVSHQFLMLNKQIFQRVEQLTATVNHSTQGLQKVIEESQNQATAIADLQKTQTLTHDDLQLSAAAYLVKLANDQLIFNKNVPQAIKLLQAADAQFAKFNMIDLLMVRQALAADVVALQSVVVVDTAGLYARLIALDTQLENLPVPDQFKPSVTLPAEVADVAWWRRGLQNTWHALQQVVVIRKGAQNHLPFVLPEQRVLLIQNLHLALTQAEWGLLHQQTEIYRLSLQQAIHWIKQYAVQDSSMTQQLITRLTELMQIEVNPPIPDASRSLQAVQIYLKEK